MIILVAAALQDGAEVLTNRAQAECAYAELSADGVLVSATQLAAAVQPSLAIGLAQVSPIGARTVMVGVRAALHGRRGRAAWRLASVNAQAGRQLHPGGGRHTYVAKTGGRRLQSSPC
jgi:hypothetical protein